MVINNRRNSSLEERLQKAIEDGDTALTKSLIGQGADIAKKISQGTPLSWAVLWGNIELTKYLLESGADINQRTVEGNLIKTAEFGKGEAPAEEKLRYDELIRFLKTKFLPS